MDDLPAAYVRYVEQLHALHDHELNFRLLSRALGVRVRPGLHNSVVPGPTPTIVLEPHLYGWSHSRIGLHELGHLFLTWSGVERRLMQECVTRDRAFRALEELAQLTVAVLQIPASLLAEGAALHGDAPEVIVHLADRSGAPLSAAMRRWVYQDSHTARAAFITGGRYISDVAAFGTPRPFEPWTRVPDPAAQFPDVRLCSVSPGRSVGVFVGS